MWRPRYGTISNAQASPGSVPDRTSRAPVAPQTAAKLRLMRLPKPHSSRVTSALNAATANGLRASQAKYAKALTAPLS